MKEESKLGLCWPVQLCLRSWSLVFILRSWKADGYCLLHPDFLARLLASQPAPRSPARSMSNQLNPSFAPLVMGMKSQRCLLPTMLLNNNTRTHNRVLPADFGETSCLLPPRVLHGERESGGKVISQGTQPAAAASSGLEQCLEGKMGKK